MSAEAADIGLAVVVGRLAGCRVHHAEARLLAVHVGADIERERHHVAPLVECGTLHGLGEALAVPANAALAERVQGDLVTGGYDEQDAMLFDAGDVIPSAQKQLENADWLARLGRADEMVQTHLNAAKGGSTFLLVYAPSDPEAERVMNVARRGPLQFAHRYRRFAIETLK